MSKQIMQASSGQHILLNQNAVPIVTIHPNPKNPEPALTINKEGDTVTFQGDVHINGDMKIEKGSLEVEGEVETEDDKYIVIKRTTLESLSLEEMFTSKQLAIRSFAKIMLEKMQSIDEKGSS